MASNDIVEPVCALMPLPNPLPRPNRLGPTKRACLWVQS